MEFLRLPQAGSSSGKVVGVPMYSYDLDGHHYDLRADLDCTIFSSDLRENKRRVHLQPTASLVLCDD